LKYEFLRGRGYLSFGELRQHSIEIGQFAAMLLFKI